jgi:outer membrane protein assembly complex protein YaeT
MDDLPQMKTSPRHRCRALVGLCLCLWPTLLSAARIEVDGFGWLLDLKVERVIREVLETPEDAPLEVFQLEDSLLILHGELESRGFLDPAITVKLFRQTEEEPFAQWVFPDRPQIDAISRADRVVLGVEKGVRSYLEDVNFEGLTVIEPEVARSYFYPTNALLVPESARANAPGKINRSVDSLLRRLALEGYPEAKVTELTKEPVPDEKGAVRLTVTVDEGRLFQWREVSYDWGEAVNVSAIPVSLPSRRTPPGPYTQEHEQDFAVELRNRFLTAGYPDVKISSTRSVDDGAGGQTREVTVNFRVNPGPRVKISEITFRGLENTSEPFLQRRMPVESGDWLNRVALESGRRRLGRLGIFDDIRLRYEPPEDPVERAVVFEVEEGLRREINLLAGYGSYEQFRVGAEMRFYNVLGRAHQGVVRLRQSMKSSAATLTYSAPAIPWFFDRAQIQFQGLIRDEISFTREEAAFMVGVERELWLPDLTFVVEYAYEVLRSTDLASDEVVGDQRATVGSITLGLSLDRRDRIIAPRNGFDVRSELELASPSLGSDAYFQRWVIAGAWHKALADETIRLHFGLEHGVLARVGAEAAELPFNKRFFPGGVNSLRGYQDGEASPLGSEGETLGAETYLLGHAEVEVAILHSLSVVTFLDGLLQARELGDYPGNEDLWSLGIGLRYDTPLGPLRLEYGHNLNPRSHDPDGTLHFSLGFPF